MNRFLKKVLVYSLAIALLVPTWLVTGTLSADRVHAADSIAGWNFPNNPDDSLADLGASANILVKSIAVGGGVNAPAFDTSGATTRSASATGWANGSGTKYWQIEFSAAGYTALKLSSKQRSSNTGPRDFIVEYKVGSAGIWTAVPLSTVTVANNYTSGSLSNVALPSETSNEPSIFVRWVMASNLQVDQLTPGTEVGSTGVSNIDDVLVSGDPVSVIDAPTLIPVVSPTNDSTPTLQWVPVVATPAVDKYIVTIDGGAGIEVLAPSTSYEPVVGLSEGSHTWSVKAQSGSSVSQDSAIGTFIIDSISATPVINKVTSPVNADSQMVTGIAEANSLIRINGGLVPAIQQLTGGATNFSIEVFLNQNTVNTLSIMATDILGNESAVATVVITEDSIVPAAPIVDPLVYPAGTTVIIITGVAEDNSLVTVTNGAATGSRQLMVGATRFSIPIELTPGVVNTLSLTATDAAGNVSETTTYAVDPVNGEQTIVVDGSSDDTSVNIPVSVTDAVIDLDSLAVIVDPNDGTQSVAMPVAVNLNTTTAEGKIVSVHISAGTVITGPATWNRKLNALQLKSSAGINPIVDQYKEASNVVAWEVGAGDRELTFNVPVKIVFAGQAGQSVGYYRNGMFTAINAVCDTLVPPTIAGNGECRSVSGNDLVVWTKHFTQYVTYSQNLVPLVAPSVNIVEQNNTEKTAKVEWQGIGRGVEKYEIFINGVLSVARTNISGDDSSVKYSQDVKVNNTGKYDVIVRAYRGNDMVQSAAKSVEFTAPAAAATTAPAPQTVAPTTTSSQPAIAPARAKAQTESIPTIESPSPAPEEAEASDDNGIIAGENEPLKDSINWTPWIILFVLIILAGAATGGYFFWFGGEEELETNVRVPAQATEEKKEARVVPASQTKKKANTGKQKRW